MHVFTMHKQTARPAANSWKRRNHERTIAQQNLDLYSR